MGTLKVGLLESDSSSERVVWSRSGNHGQGWQDTRVDVSNSGVMARVYIEAIVGAGVNRGNIGIDTIDLRIGDSTAAMQPLSSPAFPLTSPTG